MLDQLQYSNNVLCGLCIRKNTAIAICIDCNPTEYLCQICKEEHPNLKKSKNHKLVNREESFEMDNVRSYFPDPPAFCPQHNNMVLKFFCKTCQELICRDCLDLQHNDHRSNCQRVEQSEQNEMGELLPKAKKSKDAITKLDDAIAQCKEKIQLIEAGKKEMDNSIVSSLQKVKEVLFAKNEEVRLQKVTVLEIQVIELKTLRGGLALALEMITASQLYSTIQQLSTKKLLTERTDHLLSQFTGRFLEPQVTATFFSKVAEQATISHMVALGDIKSRNYASTGTCDAAYVPWAAVDKERIVKVIGMNADGKLFPIEESSVKASLSLQGSKGHPIPLKMSSNTDDTCSLAFTAQSTGEHLLQITINGYPIKGSPYSFIARQQKNYTSLTCQANISTYKNPLGVAVVGDGQVAVAEFGYHTVSLYLVNGKRQHTFDINRNHESADGQFCYPSGVAISGDIMYVSEHSNNHVQKFSISGKCFVSKFGHPGKGDGEFSSPRGITIDPEGKVFVADHNNHRVQVFQPDGTFAYSIPADKTQPHSSFKKPWGLTFDPQGLLHIAAYGSHCIKVFTPEGRHVDTYGTGKVSGPTGISIDEAGYVAITENGANCFTIFDPTHTKVVNKVLGFSNPVGIAQDSEGALLIADNGCSCVQKY